MIAQPTKIQNKNKTLPYLAISFIVLVSQSANAQPSLFDRNNTSGRCSPIITGDIGANAKINVTCSNDIPEGVVHSFKASLNKFFTATIAPSFEIHQRTERNLNNYIENLENQLKQAEENYQKAISQNRLDLQNRPENPWLSEEKRALESGNLVAAAELREQYYQEKETQQLTLLAEESRTVGDSWSAAFNWQKAIKYYEKSLNYNPKQTRLWWELYKIYVRFGNNSEVLTSIEGFLANTPESDLRTQSVALTLKGNWHLKAGNLDLALTNYQKALTVIEKLV